VQNPSSKVVVIQLALDSVYLQGNRLMGNLPERLVFSFIYDLFNGAVSNSHCIVLNGRLSKKLERMWKEGVMA
jgi:hypothetical protein